MREAICRGIVEHIDADRHGRFLLVALREFTTHDDIERAIVQLIAVLETVTAKECPGLIDAWDM